VPKLFKFQHFFVSKTWAEL